LTPLSIVLILISALLHSSWNFFAKKGNWPLEFFFWVFLWGVLLYIPFFIGFGVSPTLFLQSPPRLLENPDGKGLYPHIGFGSDRACKVIRGNLTIARTSCF